MMLNRIADVVKKVRENTPLVQAITNYVTINDCANILLSFGASPAMVEVDIEVEEFVNFISALYINTGTLTREQEAAAIAAARRSSELNKPVIIDPVACGAINRKVDVIMKILENGKVSVIKGNIGEIKFLAGYSGKVRGVDSIDDGDGAIEACKILAKRLHTVVIATGETDIISDGERTCLIENGTPALTLVTGAGCMVGALVAAAAGVEEDMFIASMAAVISMGLAGEMAEASLGEVLPGSFKVKLFDYMYKISPEEIMRGGKIRCL